MVNDTVSSDNTDAGTNVLEGLCWDQQGGGAQNDVWFSFVAPSNGMATVETIDTDAGNDDTQLAIYSSDDGTCTGVLTEVGCNEDIDTDGGLYMSSVDLMGLTPGETYFVQVDGWGAAGTVGGFDISVTSEPSFCEGSTAIICDDIDTYPLGSIAGLAPHWIPWPGGDVVAEVTDEQAFSGANSLKVGPGGVEDNILYFGDQAGGTYTLDWEMYLPAGATGYFNIQADPTIGNAFIYQLFLNEDGAAPGAGTFQQLAETFTYPEDAWFHVSIAVDMDALTHSLNIDGVDVLVDAPYVSNAGPGPASTFTGINFYSIDDDNTYYLDNVVLDGTGFVAPCPAPDAVICDNIDSYTLGSIDGQAAHWAPWTPGSTDVAEVVNNRAFSNDQSLRVGPGGTEDNLLLLNDETEGVWTVDWKMYVPADSTAFFNIQADPVPGEAFIFQAFCNQAGAAPGEGSFQIRPETFTYPEDAWFDVSITVDLNNLIFSLVIDGVAVLDGLPYEANIGTAVGLSSINFYSIDDENTFYLDDVVYDGDPTVSILEYSQAVYSVFPNPTNGMITVQGEENIDAIVVRNILGATVMNVESPFSNTVNLDMSALENGVYLLEIQVGNDISINRVIKK
jgi:hypothetical protein